MINLIKEEPPATHIIIPGIKFSTIDLMTYIFNVIGKPNDPGGLTLQIA